MIEPRAQGDWRALEAKLRPFVARRLRSPADVEDVVQEVLLRLQQGGPMLRDPQRFGPWAYQVARHAVVDHQRALRRRPFALGEPLEELPARSEEQDRAVERLVANYVGWFVGALPSPYKEALTLTELEGKTQREAARILGVSLSGMKSRVQRGRLRLRQALEDCCEIQLDRRGRIYSCEPRSSEGALSTSPRCRTQVA